jgi:MFS family permease
MAFLLIAPNLPAIQQTFASEPNIAVLAPIALTIPALMIAIFSAPAGFLADRLGRRQVLIGSLFVYLIAGTAPALLNSIGAIIAARAVVGLAEAAIVTCKGTIEMRAADGVEGGVHWHRPLHPAAQSQACSRRRYPYQFAAL